MILINIKKIKNQFPKIKPCLNLGKCHFIILSNGKLLFIFRNLNIKFGKIRMSSIIDFGMQVEVLGRSLSIGWLP